MNKTKYFCLQNNEDNPSRLRKTTPALQATKKSAKHATELLAQHSLFCLPNFLLNFF
jgi:hypothetical protein